MVLYQAISAKWNPGISFKNKSVTADKTGENIYVDNVITDTESAEDAVQFYRKVKQIFSQSSMNLRDWTSNDTKVLDKIPLGDRSVGEKIKVLGLTWVDKEDNLSLNQITWGSVSDISKGKMLKQIASVYDTLGLCSPSTLQGKVFLQELWNKKLS